jgi:predicted RNA-binding protein with TRAM domain
MPLVAYTVQNSQVTDGEVYAVRIVKAGSGCKASTSHTLSTSCPSRTACQRPEAAAQLVAVAEVKNGAVVRVRVLSVGRGYLNKPLLQMPASAECSEAPVLLAGVADVC